MAVLAVAHRAGNSLPALRAAVEAGADVLELDVHSSRSRLEVRHSKSLGPLPFLWDRQPWTLTPRPVAPLVLHQVLDALPRDATVMLDLKGVGAVGVRTVEAVHARAPEVPVLVCSRWWPAVEAFAAAPWARRVLSARGRAELLRLRRRVRAGSAPYGVSLHHSLLTAPVVTELRDRVELVMTWGVNDLGALREVVDLGVNGVITDSTEVLLAAQR